MKSAKWLLRKRWESNPPDTHARISPDLKSSVRNVINGLMRPGGVFYSLFGRGRVPNESHEPDYN